MNSPVRKASSPPAPPASRAPVAGVAAAPLHRLLDQAADALAAVRAGTSLGEALERCPPDLRPGTQALSFHAMRWLGSAQAVRALLAERTPPPRVDALLLTCLALMWPAAAPAYADHTLVDQAVTAARRRTPGAASFVNALLRRFVRERDVLVAAARRTPEGEFNHTVWWIERVRADWPQHWRALLQADQAHPPLTLRVNARRSDAQAYVGALAERGLGARACDTHTVILDTPVPVQRLPGFAQGLVSVQDAAAQRAAPLLLGGGLPPRARVLDACAAPGGKSAHLLELADLDLVALDVDASRLARVEDTLARLSLSATPTLGDASDPTAWWDGRAFDAILLDAPCSASGVVRRHPDARWLRRAGDIAALARTQARMLDALWPLLAPRGRLLYATCSIFRAEGQAQIDAFLQRTTGPPPRVDAASPGHLLALPDNEAGAGGPGAAGDGFFYALLHKA